MDTRSQQPSTLKYVSLFSGIEAASVAWEPLGFTPLAFAEVEPFPSAVLAERFPHIPNLGDVTAIDWCPYRGAVDIVVGGSPCQSFSIAGRREGLKGASGLMFEYIRAVREILPRFFVWENVPGALSVEGGAAFGQLLREMDELGYGLAWRILDAQFVRVPNGEGDGFTGPVAQRRRRLFLVGSLDSQCAADILFEPDSLHGDHPSSRKKREELARTAGHRAYPPSGATICGNIIGRGEQNGGHQVGISEDNVSFTLTTADHHAVCSAGSPESHDSQATHTLEARGVPNKECTDVMCLSDDNAKASCDCNLSGALKVGGSAPIVSVQAPVPCQTQYGDELAGTLTARNDSSPCADRGQNILCRASGMANAETLMDCAPCQVARQYKDPSLVCLSAVHASQTNTPACTLKIRGGCEGGGKGALVQQELSATLATHQDQTLFSPENQEYVVRRLMPIECERLQGFPDDWTRIAWRNKSADECPDTPRFKALGNSMAVPVMRWIGWRIAQID